MPILELADTSPTNVARFAASNGISEQEARTRIEAFNKYATEHNVKEYVSALMTEADSWLEAVDGGDLIEADIGTRPELIERLRAEGKSDLANAIQARVEQEVEAERREEESFAISTMSDDEYVEFAKTRAAIQKNYADTQAGIEAMEQQAEVAQVIIDKAMAAAASSGLDPEAILAHGIHALETGRAPDIENALHMATAEATIDRQALAQVEAQLDAEIAARRGLRRGQGMTTAQQRAELNAETDDEYRARRLQELEPSFRRDLLAGPLPTPQDVHDAEVAAYQSTEAQRMKKVTEDALAARQKLAATAGKGQPFDHAPTIQQMAEQLDKIPPVPSVGGEPNEFGGGYREAMARAEAAATVGTPKTAYGDGPAPGVLDPRGGFPEAEPGDAAEQYRRAFRD
jgi:hypothetical protein